MGYMHSSSSTYFIYKLFGRFVLPPRESNQWASQFVEGFHDFGHLASIDEAIAIQIVHIEGNYVCIEISKGHIRKGSLNGNIKRGSSTYIYI